MTDTMRLFFLYQLVIIPLNTGQISSWLWNYFDQSVKRNDLIYNTFVCFLNQ